MNKDKYLEHLQKCLSDTEILSELVAALSEEEAKKALDFIVRMHGLYPQIMREAGRGIADIFAEDNKWYVYRDETDKDGKLLARYYFNDDDEEVCKFRVKGNKIILNGEPIAWTDEDFNRSNISEANKLNPLW